MSFKNSCLKCCRLINWIQCNLSHLSSKHNYLRKPQWHNMNCFPLRASIQYSIYFVSHWIRRIMIVLNRLILYYAVILSYIESCVEVILITWVDKKKTSIFRDLMTTRSEAASLKDGGNMSINWRSFIAAITIYTTRVFLERAYYFVPTVQILSLELD